MLKGFFNIPVPENEPVLNYLPGSSEKAELKEMLLTLKSQVVDIPMFIGGQEIRTEDKKPLIMPHNHAHVLGYYHQGDKGHVEQAVNAALGAKEAWEQMAWEQRAAIFLKAADLIAGPFRAKLNAATMLGQSKNVFQAEIDAACELIDFLKFNTYYMSQIYAQQPGSAKNICR